MQKLIAKYGVAAHLAILAVAPLFLFPFYGEGTIATVLLWLAVPAQTWLLMEPSLRSGERLHDARRRVAWGLLTDPLLWVGLVLVVFTGIRALNTGIALAYDAETAKWVVNDARFPFFPGSVGSAGYLPFAGMVAMTVLLEGCRHSLGRSARMAFLLLVSTLSGLAALIAIFLAAQGNAAVLHLMKPSQTGYSFVGAVFALDFLASLAALVAAFERKWRLDMPLFPLAIGCTAAGAFAFAPAYVSCVFAIAGILLLVYAFFYSSRALPSSGEFKMLVVCGISLTLGGLAAVACLPEDVLADRLAAYRSFEFFGERFLSLREILTSVALKTWKSHIWIGTGVGSFPLDFRFGATAAGWAHVPGGVAMASNGWWQLLVERGVVGALALALPFGFLLVSYFVKMARGFGSHALPHPAGWLAPLGLAALCVTGTYDCSFLRPDVLMCAAALAAVSAQAFSKKKREDNG